MPLICLALYLRHCNKTYCKIKSGHIRYLEYIPIYFNIYYALFLLLKRDIIQSNTIAPITDVIKLPMILVDARPKRPNIQPPSTPPIIPTIKLMISPNPPPRIILPAKKPATMPIMIYKIQLIL